MKIALGADHRGSLAAAQLGEVLSRAGHAVELVVPQGSAPCDYPEPAYRVGRAVSGGRAELGVLICGTGIGMSIAANKIPGVRAAVVHDELTAQLSRTHNNANIACLSGDLLGQRIIEKIVEVFIHSTFEGGRHERRLRKIAAIEQGTDPSSVADGA